MERSSKRFFLALCFMALGLGSWSADATAPGRAIEVVDATVQPPVTQMVSAEQIAALKQERFRTSTEFTDGRPEFVGPLVADVLKLVGSGTATTARMSAANDYAIDIPITDFTKYGVILAHTIDGKRLTLRDKGPYWVMYPLDDHVELRDPLYNNRLIWQLVKIELR